MYYMNAINCYYRQKKENSIVDDEFDVFYQETNKEEEGSFLKIIKMTRRILISKSINH